jgi:DNA replication protein DnaC
VFGDEVMAAALIDRVLHHCHLLNIGGNSYRMREHMDLYRRLRSDVDNSAEAARLPRKPKAGSGNRR